MTPRASLGTNRSLISWLPSFGRGETVQIGSWWTTGFLTVSGLKALILPSITTV